MDVESQTSVPKRRIRLTDSSRKASKRMRNRKADSTRVYLGSQYDRFMNLKEEIGPETTVSTFVDILIDSSCCSSPVVSGVERLTSESDQPQSSEDLRLSSTKRIAVPLKKQSFIYSFEESCDTDDHFDVDDELNLPSNAIKLSTHPQEEDAERVSFGDETFDVGEGSQEDDDEEHVKGEGVLHVNDPDDIVHSPAAIAYEQCLLDLAQTDKRQCSTCSEPLEIKSSKRGSAIYLTWVCENDHVEHKWGSQPLVQNMQGGDLLLSSAVILSGNNFAKVKLRFQLMNLGIVSAPTHYNIQKHYTIPTINAYWDSLSEQILHRLQGRQVIVAGDGRNDSPGHSAQYCTYSVLDFETEDLLCCVVVDKRQTDLKSPNMERLGLEQSLRLLLDNGVDVVEVITDQHVQITSMMKKTFPWIKHSYDIWHMAKNLNKRVNQAGLQKGNERLLLWAADIVNHCWYCAKKAKGDRNRFISHWRGLLHHVTGVHSWALPDSEGDHSCHHGDDRVDDPERVLWPGSEAHNALIKIVMDRRFLNNVPYVVNFRHTGLLETFNNHQLMYAAKRFAYGWPAYKARCLLAAIDYQKHKDRPVAIDRDGETSYARMWNKRTSNWTVHVRKAPKTYDYIPELMDAIVEMRLDDTEPLKRKAILSINDPRRIASTIAKENPPPTSELVAAHQSRFSQN